MQRPLLQRLLNGVLACALALGTATAQAQPSEPQPSYINGLRGQANGAITGVVDLSRAWRRALEYDHNYQAAISEQAAAQTEEAMGRAGLLPQIQAGYSRSQVKGDAVSFNALGQSNSSELSYTSTNAYIQLQQPIVNFGRYAGYQRGIALANEGTAIFAARRQATALRLTEVYLNVLLAHDNLGLQRSLVEVLEARATALEAHLKQFEGTVTAVQETQARLAVARADMIDAADQLQVAERELAAMLGGPVARLSALQAEHFPLTGLQPAGLAQWLELARTNNAEVRAARQAVAVAETEVDQATSRYLPTLDLIVSVSKADSENLSTLSQRSNTFMAGLQANIPIFTGGYNTANVSRTRADQKRLQHELTATLERTQAEVMRQYTNVLGGAERIRAFEAAVESGQQALHATEQSFRAGVLSNLDVLRAQDTLYRARFDLVRARLEYLLARLSLASAAGTLDDAGFDSISQTYLGRVITLQEKQEPSNGPR
ncbi:TolC family outer membrane protein [Pusillimonas sp. MFBS29]|uniref:TolC family outer membrane protein n=1 Tax=Pusillimonas sp. MFBS29 TaxID=2886690 RepID=UPI001D124B85|nr:TolC family outer membrane protein [Pusillimonas sp. MFBS29]MCC2596132.1 TolC family outer membrane protein [Pusillimonas sp. MFBS29]